MKKLLLILSFTLGLTTAANANTKDFAVGDVFFCEMEAFLSWEWDEGKVVNYKPQKFKFTVSDETTLKFGREGYLQGVELKITWMSDNLLDATKDSSVMSLKDGKFNYVSSFYSSASMIAATCDRF